MLGGTIRTVLDSLRPARKRQLAWLTLFAIANAAADLLMVASAINFLLALADDAKAWVPSLPAAAILFAGSAVAANLVRLLYLRSSESFSAEVVHELTMEAQRRVLAQPYPYHVDHPSSELIASLHKVELLGSILVHQWLSGVAALASGLAVLAFVASIDPVPALAAFAGFALIYLGIAGRLAKRLAANSAIVGDAYDKRIGKVQESIGAIRDLKLDHSERAHLDDLREVNARYAAAQASTGFIAGAPRPLVEAGAGILLAAFAVLLAGGGAALALVAGVAIGGLRVLPLFQLAYRTWATVRANRVIAEDVKRLLTLPMPADDQSEPAPLPFRRSLKLVDVGLRYPGRLEPALRDICLEIRRGQRVALTGETGSGKSTLADIVMGLLLPGSGHIEVDGNPLAPDQVRAWQKNIAHVAQNLFLADASIACNIAFSLPGRPIDMERLRRAAALAEIEEFIDSLPQGFDTMVGERGVRLSGGQRQRLGIARALYKQAPLLILDEATNALDRDTEAAVLANLFANRDWTILVISHRDSTVAGCDAVFRLEQGRLVGP